MYLHFFESCLTGEVEEAVVAKYIAHFSTLSTKIDGRIFVANADPEPEVITKPFYKRMTTIAFICLSVLAMLVLVVAYKIYVGPIIRRRGQQKYTRHTHTNEIMVDAEESSLQQYP